MAICPENAVRIEGRCLSQADLFPLHGKGRVRQFAVDYCEYLEGVKWLVSKWFLALMRPFWGKANDALFKAFIRPIVQCFTEAMKRGENLVTYDAPAALYFYASAYADPADPIVTATYAMIAAESLGLTTCMLGSVHPFLQHGRAARQFRERYGIRNKSREGLIVIMGYPRVQYRKGIRRTLASVDIRR